MNNSRILRIAISIIACFLLQAQGADKYTDENRPYEFGFRIDGQQHRHEEKDKDGIIMGEFGFVTADDVYHVTVYATDKEGRFKILSMKNIHLKSSQAGLGSSTSSRQGHALTLPPVQPAAAAPKPPPSQPSPKIETVSLEPPGRSCSSCSLPPTTTKAPALPPPQLAPVPASNQFGSPNQFASPIPQGPSSFPQQENFGGPPNYSTNQQVYPQSNPSSPAYSQPPVQTQQSYPSPGQGGFNQPIGYANQNNIPQGGQEYPNSPSPGQSLYPQGASGDRTPKQYNGPEQQYYGNGGFSGPQGLGSIQGGPPGPAKPTLVSAQMQIVDKNTNIHALRPGEKEGLPPGLKESDMTDLLYTFNYTVGFHGHFEEGYRNGAKKGYYYVTGRNGVRTRIDYTADDTGFHPRVSQEVLDLLSDDVPKPETEQDAKYGLKGYEFKWLYYPVNSK